MYTHLYNTQHKYRSLDPALPLRPGRFTVRPSVLPSAARRCDHHQQHGLAGPPVPGPFPLQFHWLLAATIWHSSPRPLILPSLALFWKKCYRGENGRPWCFAARPFLLVVYSLDLYYVIARRPLFLLHQLLFFLNLLSPSSFLHICSSRRRLSAFARVGFLFC